VRRSPPGGAPLATQTRWRLARPGPWLESLVVCAPAAARGRRARVLAAARGGRTPRRTPARRVVAGVTAAVRRGAWCLATAAVVVEHEWHKEKDTARPIGMNNGPVWVVGVWSSSTGAGVTGLAYKKVDRQCMASS